MSKATKRKHVTREVLDEFVTPEDKQIIVKILGSRGNNLHEAETPAGDHFLISMPSKFRKNVWIKRGNFVIVDPIEEGNKVCAEIAHILYPQQVKYLKKEGLWPETFMEKPFEQNHHLELLAADTTKTIQDCQDSCSDSESEIDEDSDLFVNTNHIQSLVIHSESGSSDEESNEEGDKEETDQKNIIENNNMNKIA